MWLVFCFKQKTAYEMRISDWSSDVCSSDLKLVHYVHGGAKLMVVAPAMTLGIMHLLSWLSGVPVDSTMVSSVFGTIVAADTLKSLGKTRSEERRVGKECFSTCRSRLSPDH